MNNTYSSLLTPLSETLHGAARLHVALGRMEGARISTRAWSYNELVTGILSLSGCVDPSVRLARCLAVLFDTLDAMPEIGAEAVKYLHDLAAFDVKPQEYR